MLASGTTPNGGASRSLDTDFRERSFLDGAPPHVIWLDVANAATGAIIELLRGEQQRVLVFGTQLEASVLILSPERESPDR